MKQLWQRYAAKFDALTQRERWIVLLGSGAALGFVLWSLLVDPIAAENKRLAASLAQQQQQLGELRGAVRAMQAARVDPDAANRARRDQLNADIADLERKLRAVGKTLVAADRMPRLLESLLGRNSHLQLVALNSIAAAPLVPRQPAKAEARPEAKDKPAAAQAPSAPPAAAPDVNIYRHGVELTVEGAYLDLLDYLAQVEKLPWQMYWGKASLSAAQYPRVTLTLTVYTLSLDKMLLAV